MEFNLGPVVKKKLLNIIKEKVPFERKHLFYNVEKLKSYRKRKNEKEEENQTIYSPSIEAPLALLQSFQVTNPLY